MKKLLKSSFALTVALMVLCGLIYPLLVTGIGQVCFHKKANGSIEKFQGKEVGSSFLGQNFTDEKFFRGRVSSINYNTYVTEDTKPDKDGVIAYTGVSSGSQNLAPSNPQLKARVKKDMSDFLKQHPYLKQEDIPTDMLTSSGSGLDPEISTKSAEIQIKRVSKATAINERKIRELVDKNTIGRSLGIFGEKRVNVLKLNIEIKKLLVTKQ